MYQVIARRRVGQTRAVCFVSRSVAIRFVAECVVHDNVVSVVIVSP